MKSKVTITIEVNNPYGIIRFEDYLNLAKKAYDIEREEKLTLFNFLQKNKLLYEYREYTKNKNASKINRLL